LFRFLVSSTSLKRTNPATLINERRNRSVTRMVKYKTKQLKLFVVAIITNGHSFYSKLHILLV